MSVPATAFANPYPAEPPPSSVSSGTVPEGGKVTFSGRGFLPFEKISIKVSYGGSNSSAAFRQRSAGGFVPVLARRATLLIIADKDGAFSVQLSLSQIGTATLVATGLTSGRTVTAYVTVVAPTDRHDGDGGGGGGGHNGGGNPGLPRTGQSGALLLTLVSSGAAAVLLGGVLLGFARRRRDKTE